MLRTSYMMDTSECHMDKGDAMDWAGRSKSVWASLLCRRSVEAIASCSLRDLQERLPCQSEEWGGNRMRRSCPKLAGSVNERLLRPFFSPPWPLTSSTWATFCNSFSHFCKSFSCSSLLPLSTPLSTLLLNSSSNSSLVRGLRLGCLLKSSRASSFMWRRQCSRSACFFCHNSACVDFACVRVD